MPADLRGNIVIINVTDDIRIKKADSRNYNIEHRHTNSKTGEDAWTLQGHYTSVERAVQGIIRSTPPGMDDVTYDLRSFTAAMHNWREAVMSRIR